MSMNIQDMAAVMAAKNEAFRGTEQVPEKVTIYNQLRAHAAAIVKTLRTPMHPQTVWNCGSRTRSSMWNFRSPSAF